MEILITLPPHFAGHVRKHRKRFPEITGVFSDPSGKKLGSGGGTVNVLWQQGVKPGSGRNDDVRRIIVHADGQSRRLPAYAPVGKSFIPVPVFKWERGQHVDQTLFDLQLPLLKKILELAPPGMNTLVASGDALVLADCFHGRIPMTDVACLGVWASPEVASRHGVFVCTLDNPAIPKRILQKPTLSELQDIAGHHLYLLDAGIWLLSDKAVAVLFEKCGWDPGKGSFNEGAPAFYDLYTDLGKLMSGEDGTVTENRVIAGRKKTRVLSDEKKPLSLNCRIITSENATFYHFGSNTDLLQSTTALHNRVTDQRGIWHKRIKPDPVIFVQNSITKILFDAGHSSIWIENSWIPQGWTLHDHHIITGVPENDFVIDLPAGICLDFIPVARKGLAIRIYRFNDLCRRPAGNADCDPYFTSVYPVYGENELSTGLMQWLIKEFLHGVKPSAEDDKGAGMDLPRPSALMSAAELVSRINHDRLEAQRKSFLIRALGAMGGNFRYSIFYQLDLQHLADIFSHNHITLPSPPGRNDNIMVCIHDHMFRSACTAIQNNSSSRRYEEMAFSMLREGMLDEISMQKHDPVMTLKHDQIVWVRSPLRLDLAGGWTDTPPYCILYGGAVTNLAVMLNGQPPIQVYIRRTRTPEIVIHSIDLGVSETISNYKQLLNPSAIGSAFSIPRAALALAGFHPQWSLKKYPSLKRQLAMAGGGIDISLMVAVPKGSGLGTSSILASAVLGGLSAACDLGWDLHEVAYRTLLLEQLLTTGGGWQDQLGGIFEGVKLIESAPGLRQKPTINWAPDQLFTRPEYHDMVLLYYTGITRVARRILKDIVKGMFLNSSQHLAILSEMKHHARYTYEAIQHQDWNGLTDAVRHSWMLNQKLDSGTNPPQVAAIHDSVGDWMSACKLLGAGGGGYLMIFAKDIPAVMKIRSKLEQHPPNARARFVDWEMSRTGLEVTRS